MYFNMLFEKYIIKLPMVQNIKYFFCFMIMFQEYSCECKSSVWIFLTYCITKYSAIHSEYLIEKPINAKWLLVNV